MAPFSNMQEAATWLVMQRDLRELDVFRLWLVTSDNREFAWIQRWIQDENDGRRWGVLGPEIPLSQNDLQEAESLLRSSEEKKLALFDPQAASQASRITRIARSAAFRNRVLLVGTEKPFFSG